MLEFLEDADVLHNLEREPCVLEAVIHDALRVALPLGVHLLRVDVVLLPPKQLLRDRVERLLPRPDFALDVPPRVGHDAAAHRPGAVRALLGFAAVAPQHQFHPVQFRPLLEQRQVVAVDVVAGNHVRVMLCNGGGEAGDDAGFTAVQHLLRDQLAAVMDREAKAEEAAVQQRILDVETEDAQRRGEGLGRCERRGADYGAAPATLLEHLAFDRDAAAEVVIVDVAKMERDVGRQHHQLAGAQPVAQLRHLAGVPHLDPQAVALCTVDP